MMAYFPTEGNVCGHHKNTDLGDNRLPMDPPILNCQGGIKIRTNERQKACRDTLRGLLIYGRSPIFNP
jgi:hypothetical protein